jgi:hypothetical protein
MFFSSWLRNRKLPSRPFRRSNRCRPRLEVLEDRAVPAIFNVTTTLDVIDPNDGLLSLREAVLAANATPGADTIDLSAGRYVLSLGQLEVRDDLTIAGAGPVNLATGDGAFIDAAQQGRVFQVLGAHVNIVRVAITGGSASRGAGIDVVGGTLQVTNSLIGFNRALSSDGTDAMGGGIYNQGGTVTIAHSLVVVNTAFADTSGNALGGGIYNDGGSLSITASQFHGCEARISYGNTSSALGGGIYNAGGTVAISYGIFVRNWAISVDAGSAGGAHIYHASGLLTITNSEFFDGRATSDFGNASGGAIHIAGGDVTVTNTIFADNVGRGAIYIERGSLRITNCTFLRNGRGALYVDGGTVCVSRNTIFLDGFGNPDPDGIFGPYTNC